MPALFIPTNKEDTDSLCKLAGLLLPDSAGYSSADSHAVAVIDSNRNVLAIILYSQITNENCQMHIVSKSPKWAAKGVLQNIFGYAFGFLGLHRVTAVTRMSNTRAQKMLHMLSFNREGELREYFDGKENGIIFGLLSSECQFKKAYDYFSKLHYTQPQNHTVN